jgi:hypothetical protein
VLVTGPVARTSVERPEVRRRASERTRRAGWAHRVQIAGPVPLMGHRHELLHLDELTKDRPHQLRRSGQRRSKLSPDERGTR